MARKSERKGVALTNKERQKRWYDKRKRERKLAGVLTLAERRAERERLLAANVAALPDQRFGVIVADPEWRFETRSRLTGMSRAADNHYPTSTLDVIKARDVASIAAPACLLALWATSPMLPQALEVMAVWGFTYKSILTWDKEVPGTGYWFRNQTEHLLIGTRGDVPAPFPGSQIPSLLRRRRTVHSAKPDDVLEWLERVYPTVAKIELNRRGPARPGWSAWGNEAEESERTGT